MAYSALHELYQNSKGSTYQCDLTNRIHVQFNGMLAIFRIQDFLAFRRKVLSVDIHEMIFNLSDNFDYELVEAPQAQLSWKLTLCEIVQLRDLLDGTKFVLMLNSMICEVLGESAIA
ncbi:MAG: hypothetical protein ACOVQ4_12430 [Flectobacillus sp.]|uniref:hypothetical protein n=1 Tax=Flectobacillus sp. TaxID=50419 RepID=UPI003B995018